MVDSRIVLERNDFDAGQVVEFLVAQGVGVTAVSTAGPLIILHDELTAQQVALAATLLVAWTPAVRVEPVPLEEQLLMLKKAVIGDAAAVAAITAEVKP